MSFSSHFIICIKAVLTEAQAEGLVGEIHLKEKELENLSGLWTKLDSSNAEGNAARNRFEEVLPIRDLPQIFLLIIIPSFLITPAEGARISRGSCYSGRLSCSTS
ncbi:hypothetical protein F3Y22_tig00117034pilonHSYRG00394 [Hibiscus syriacus]|uniref:Uncharacterized protein n=1 Tax=Hibiscus syriacus TaxID=106335 RepID=A0A6A2WCW8_HIBSY|nr:hypothetical protein F3Y22_tig00117034pilonHSYRG00394 [Hibiscus syriacus]